MQIEFVFVMLQKLNSKLTTTSEININKPIYSIWLTLFGALCMPWNGKFSYSPGSVNGSPAADDLSFTGRNKKDVVD